MRHAHHRLAVVIPAGLLIGLGSPSARPFRLGAVCSTGRPVGALSNAPDPAPRGALTARPRAHADGDGLGRVMTTPPAGAPRGAVTGLGGRGYANRTRSGPERAGPREAESWDAWVQVPTGQPRGKTHPETPDWTASPGGSIRTTPARPQGAMFASEEGPYYRTRERWEAFRLVLQYRALDRRPVIPRPPPFPHTNQDFSDSGVYIFDRYEVQVLDPSMFDGPDDPVGGVPTGGEVRDDPRVRRGGQVVPNNRNLQVPGGVYGVDIPGGRYMNWANRTGEWNTLSIEFRPPELDPADPKVITRAAGVKTVLNGHVVFDGAIQGPDGEALKGTGAMRQNPAPVARGYIYLQSHWGSQVEFRAPEIEGV